MVTGITEVTQDPEKAGNSLKILSLRLRGMKGQLEELGEETDENVENISKMQGQILNMTGGKVNIFDASGNFRSTYEIMQGIAQIWDNLSSIDQANLLETIAGKHRANEIAALLSNWQNVEAAVKSASEAEGSAAKENAKYIDSIQGRLDKLTTVWQSFANTFMNSDFLKGAISALTTFVEILEKLVDKIGTLGTIGLGAGIFSMFKNKGLFSGILGELSAFGSLSLDVWKSGGKLTNRFKDIGKAAGMDGGSIASKFTGSLSGWIGIAGLAITVISGFVTAIKNAKEEEARLRQETIETSNEFLEASSSFEQAYIKYSGKTSLTAEEEAELETAIKGTVDALGDKSSALQNVVNNSNDYVASLEAITKAELKAAESAAKEKKTAAEKELKSAVAPSAAQWLDGDSSSVNVIIGHTNLNGDTSDYTEAQKIAQEAAGEYYQLLEANRNTKYFGFELPSNASVETIVDYYYSLVEAKNRLLEKDLGETDTFDSIDKAIKKMSESIAVYESGVYDAAKAQYQLQNGIPKTAEEYLEMRKHILNEVGGTLDTRQTLANTLDSEYGQVFDLTSAKNQAQKLVGIIDAWGWGNKDGTNEIGTVETLLNMRTAVNNNECTVGQYMSQFNKVQDMILGYTDEEKELVNTSFGLDTDAIKQQYDDVVNYLTDIYATKFGNDDGLSVRNKKSEIKNFLNGLTASELSAVINLKTKIDWENASPKQIREQIEKEAALVEAISFTVDLELETEKLENLTTAVSESLSGAGLGTTSMSLVEDMFGDLDSYDPTKLFEHTANGIRMNSEEFRKLNAEYKKENIDGLEGKMDALGERYNQTREELSDLTYGSKEYNDKLRDLNNIEDQINATEKLASQYRGLASSYQSWQRAESAGSQRDMYEGMIEGFENVDDEISRGWLDDGTIEFLRLIKGENLSATATTKQLKEAYNSLDDTIKNTTYSIRDFFTVDEDGNSTNTGVYNFLDAIGQLEEEKFGGKDVVKRDKDGNIIAFDFKIAGGDEAIADALGISEELVQIMVRAADDAGFVVSMDGTYQQLDTLKDKAQEAADKLKELKITDFEFNINTGSEKSVQDQYKEALDIWAEFKKNKNKDGTVNMSVEGAEQAFTLVSTLQSMVDRLSEPVYMEIDATQVEKDMQTPLSKLQEYERLTQQENQLKLKGTDTSEIDKSQEEIIDYFEGLKPEIKAELGIKDLSREEIQAKVEAGEIEIPATIDLQVEMNNTLRDMVNVSLYNAGVIDEEELKKRVDVEVYAENVDTSDVDEKTKEEVEKKKAEARKANVEIIAETVGIEDVDDLSSKLKGLDDKTIQAIAEVLGQIDIDKLKNTIAKLDNKEVEAIAKAIGQGDVDALKTAISGLDPTYVQAIAEAFGYDDVQDLQNAIGNMDGNTVQAVAQALGITDVESLQTVIDNMQGNTVDAKVNTGGQANKIYTLQDVIDGLKGKTVDIVTNVKKVFSTIVSGGSTRNDSNGFSDVNGTANVNGTTGRAFSQGNWRTKKSETALTGELGREIIVTPQNRWYTVGDRGAEFVNIPRGSIVFNHKQTEELFRNGKVTSGGGRAKALDGGTAFAEGTAFASGSKGFGGIGKVVGDAVKNVVDSAKKTVKKTADKVASNVKNAVKNTSKKSDSPNSSYSGSKGGDDDSGGVGKVEGNSVGKDKDEFEDTFDWVEIKISRIERVIDQLDQKTNNVYKSWSSRNKALADEIGKVGEEISIQQAGYERYLKEANKVGLGESWAKKVRNGTIDISTIKDEALAEKIKDYQNWYEKALKCRDAIEELRETEASLYAQRVENVATQYEGILGVIEHEKNILDEYIAQNEANAQLVSANYYDALAKNERKNLAKLEEEKAKMLSEMQVAMNAKDDEGNYLITKGSQSWYELVGQIDEVTLAIAEGETRLKEYSQTIQQLSWESFDLLQDKISAVTEEASFLIELLSSDKLFEDGGQLTDSGKATMGQHGVSYNAYMYQADLVADEAERLKKQLASDSYDTELEERYREMIALQQEYILSAQQEKEAIRDLVSEGIELEIEALEERIDKYNEALNSQKDLYDYQKRVKEQTEEIVSLEKQMSAYSGDNSEEANAKIQELKVSLEEAKTDLKETEYDKYISDTQQMLDDLSLQYSEILNTRLDNLDALVADMITQINTDANSISTTLSEKAESVGYTLSESMKTIWDNNTTDTTNVITTYGEKFTTAQTTTNNALGTINTNLQNMIGQLNKLAKTNVKSASISSVANSEKAKPAKKEQTKKEQSKEPTKTIKVGGKINAKGAQIYDYAGDKSGERQLFRNDPVYKVLKTEGNWLQVRWHKLSKGITGWFKKGDVKALATGARRIASDDVAWTQEKGQEFIVRPSDGAILTPVAKGDSVLTSTASGNIWNMANNPAEFIRDNLNLSTADVPNNSTVSNNITQHFENITFSMPNVHGYNDLLTEMQRDPKFEKLVLSMTIDRIAGRSSLAKGKSIRN